MFKKILITCLALSMILALAACDGGTPKLHMNDYFTVEFSGTNGSGVATVKGIGEFEEDLMQKLGEGTTLMDILVIEESIDYDLDKKDGLSNGDKVTITFTIDEDIKENYGIKITGKPQTYTVKGLPEKQYTMVNPFDKLTVEFKGESPYVSVSMNDSTWGNGIDGEFTIEYPRQGSEFLQNGDKITITYIYNAEKAENKSIKITETSKEYIIEGYDTYIQSWGELSKENQDKLIRSATDIIEARIAKSEAGNDGNNGIQCLGDLELSELKYGGLYFFTPKDSTVAKQEAIYNSIFFTFKHKVELFWSSDDNLYDTYATVYIKNIVVTTDGYMVFDTSMISFNAYFADKDMMYNRVVIGNKDKYNYVDNVSFE